MAEWIFQGSWKARKLVITNRKGERKQSCAWRGVCRRGLVDPPSPLGLPLVDIQRNLPGLPEHGSKLGMWYGQGCCRPLGSVGPGKAALMGTHELPNHTILFAFFSSFFPFQDKQCTPVCSFPTGPGFGDFRPLFSNSGLSQWHW